jgi:hypothetical protein
MMRNFGESPLPGRSLRRRTHDVSNVLEAVTIGEVGANKIVAKGSAKKKEREMYAVPRPT